MFSKAYRDLVESITLWRMWQFLGSNDIVQRYRRSMIGPFWLTLSMAIFITSLGYVYSGLFKVPIHEYLPYLATGHVFYLLMNSIIIDACGSFMSAEPFLKQVPVPKLAFIFRSVYRNILIFSHNLVVLIAVLWWFDVEISPVALISLLGFLLIIINAISVSTILGLICARFRDMPQIVLNIMQVLFFVTPVLWKTEQLREEVRFLIELNPLAIFLELTRDPILGEVPSIFEWTYALIFTFVFGAVAAVFFARYRARVTYWL